MILRTIIITFVLSVALSACQSKPQKEKIDIIDKSQFERFLDDKPILKNEFKEILIIPGVGCSGCISEAQMSFNKNYKNQETLYIFTSIEDLKYLRTPLQVMP